MIDAQPLTYTVTEQERPVALALTFPEGIPPREYFTQTVAWTPTGHAALMRLAGVLREGQGGRLPTRSLAALMDLLVPGLERLRNNMALNGQKGDALRSGQLEFAWLEVSSGNPADAVQRWLRHEFKKLVKDDPRAKAEFSEVASLLERGQLLELRKPEGHLVPWGQAENHTASPSTSAEYSFLLDWAARKLEGRVLFPELPPLRRIVRRDGFQFRTAELVSDPVPTRGRAEPFSLVVQLQVVTLPTVGQPLLLLDVTKRRWVTRLKDHPPRGTLSGYVFPPGRKVAVRFEVKASRVGFQVGDAFMTLARELTLPTDLSVKQLAAGEANGTPGAVRIVHRHGFGFHNVDAGVPERNKLTAYRHLAAILGEEGMVPWEGILEVAYRRGRRASRDLLSDAQLRHAAEHPDAPGPEVGHTVRRLREHHPSDPTLILAHHVSVEADAHQAAAIIRAMTAQTMNVELVRLPDGVHGSRWALDHEDERDAAKRGGLRMDAWKLWLAELSQGLKGLNPTGVLVMAPLDYPEGSDDPVNKPAGRKAIASTLGLPVQYLLPMREKGAQDFSYRVQFAWRDLTWAHVGRIDDVGPEVPRHFTGPTPPQEVLAISVIQRNDKGNGLLGAKIPVAFKLDLHSNVTHARMAHQVGRRVEVTPWEPLPQLLIRLASMPAPEMGTSFTEQRVNFERFCNEVITEASDRQSAPLVMINSTHGAAMWSWLRDTDINAANIDFTTAGLALQERWPEVRIVRIREGNTPQLLIDKSSFCTPVGDHREPRVVHAPTSKTGALYRVRDARLPVYFSIGKRDLHREKRGQSCTESVELLFPAGKSADGQALFRVATRGPTYTQWPTPNPVEIVLARLLPGDEPDLVARFVELLRSGYGHYAEASTLPAPMFFERVVKEYITEFVDDGDPALEEELTA